MKCCRHRNSLGHKFGSLLRGRALPYAERAGGPSTHAGREWDGGVDYQAAGSNRRLDMLEQRRMALEGNREHEQIGSGASGGILVAGNLRARDFLFYALGRILS